PMQDSNIATNVRVLGAFRDESAPEALPKPARPLLAEDLRTVVIKGVDPSVVAQTVEAIHRPRIEASALPEIGGIVIRPEERAFPVRGGLAGRSGVTGRGIGAVPTRRTISDPTRRLQAMLTSSENLRQIEYEWSRFWFTDQPAHMTYDRIQGGLDGDTDNRK